MTQAVSLEHFGLTAPGTTLSLSLREGQILGVVGLAGSGKSHFLQTLQGVHRPAQGSFRISGTVAAAETGGVGGRSRPQTLARIAARVGGLSEHEILVLTGLADHRRELIHHLSPSHVAAAELIKPLLSQSSVVLIPGQLDLLDRLTLESVFQYITRRAAQGVAFVIETHRSDVLGYCDLVVGLRQRHVIFAGTIEDLRRHAPPSKIVVETDEQQSVRALVNPFEANVTASEGSLMIQTKDGQVVAAELLRQGYGDVKMLIHRESTLDEALLALLRGSGQPKL